MLPIPKRPISAIINCNVSSSLPQFCIESLRDMMESFRKLREFFTRISLQILEIRKLNYVDLVEKLLRLAWQTLKPFKLWNGKQRGNGSKL